jgi:hypothetical protein
VLCLLKAKTGRSPRWHEVVMGARALKVTRPDLLTLRAKLEFLGERAGIGDIRGDFQFCPNESRSS